MQIFLTGATGAIGQALVPKLLKRGHQVVGTTTSEGKAAQLWDAGVHPLVLDMLDRDAVITAVKQTRPDAILHEATALKGIDFRKFEQSFAVTNRLRTEGTDYLLAAAAEAGVERFIAQSYAANTYARVGGPVKAESDPIDAEPAPQVRAILDAIRHLETVVTAAGGIALLYGGFYGPGTGLEPGGELIDTIRKRRFPIVGKGRGVWSFIHIEDAASATVAALEQGRAGEIYNVTDNEPARVSEWLPYF